MADSYNGFPNLQPLLKDKYSSKLEKIVSKPNNSKQYFAHLKKYLKTPKIKKIK